MVSLLQGLNEEKKGRMKSRKFRKKNIFVSIVDKEKEGLNPFLKNLFSLFSLNFHQTRRVKS